MTYLFIYITSLSVLIDINFGVNFIGYEAISNFFQSGWKYRHEIIHLFQLTLANRKNVR